MKRFVKAAFVLKVERCEPRYEQAWHLVVQDLKTGQKLEFSSWEGLERFVETALKGGLR